MTSAAVTPHERLTELFGQAIELGDSERAALIEKVRAEEPRLADELVSLLAADAQAELATGGLVPHEDPPPIDVPGYRVTSVLGEGGMGTVYAAEQFEPQRPVAIKVLHARSGNALVRFKTEAQIMARLDHPGIARVLEAGDADGHPFLVMEHVDGETLDRYVEGVPLARRLALFVQICDAVHHAHLKGVIHRDLKPSNVMVRDGDRVVILDFGVARLADDAGITPGATRAGELLGTPLYMSPEQARLRADEVDARSDVYTLGVILYELCCNDLPYGVKGLPLPAITVVVCEDPPVPLGKKDPALRGDLEAITLKTLGKDPAERYQSVAALAEDVRRYLAGLPVSVRVPGKRERLRRFIKRRPLVALAISSAALATMTFAAVVTLLWLDARAARQLAEQATVRAESARADLERRSNQLTLKQARAALSRDPTEAVAWLATLTGLDVDPRTAWGIAEEAVARGVASHVLRGHTDEVHWVEPVAGGGFVTAGYDGRALLWEPPAFMPRELATAKQGRFHAVRPSPDGTQFAIGGDAGELYLGTRTGRLIALGGHTGDVQNLAWSHDGAWLATGDDRGRLMLWPRDGQTYKELAYSPSAIGAVAWTIDGALIAGDHAGAIWRWDPVTGARATATTGVDIVDAWGAGTNVVTVDVEGAVRVWRHAAASLTLERTIETKMKTKRCAFGPRGEWLVLGGVGGAVVRVELSTGENHSLGAHRAQVRSLAVSADGAWIADGSDDGTLTVRASANGRRLDLRGHGGRIRHLAIAGDVLLSGDSDGVVRRWNLSAPGPMLVTPEPVTQLAVSPDGAQLVAVDASGVTTLWSPSGGREVRLGSSTGRITDLALAGTTVITGTTEGEVTFWLEAPVRRSPGGIVKAIAASKDRVAVGLSTGAIAMFTLEGTPLPVIAGHAGGTDALAFDPSGTLLISGGQDRQIRAWRREGDGFAAAAPLDAPLRGDTHFVQFSPAGDRVVIAGNDGAVIAWSVRDGVVDAPSQRVLAQHTGAVTALAFDPGGRWLASAGRDARVVRSERGGTTVEVILPAAATALALDDAGGIHAVTRAGAVVRWAAGAPVIEIDHGARAAVRLPGEDRWALALDDGAVFVGDLGARDLRALAEKVVRATSYRLRDQSVDDDLVTPTSTER